MLLGGSARTPTVRWPVSRNRRRVRPRSVLTLFLLLTSVTVILAFGPQLRDRALAALRALVTEVTVPRVASESDFVAIVHATLEHEQFEGLPLSPEDLIAQGGVHRRSPVLVSRRSVVICPGPNLDPVESGCRASLFDEDLMRPGADFRVPRALRVQLGAANRESATVPDIDDPFARFVDQADIDAAVKSEDPRAWSEFYRSYPHTAGFVRTSIPVLSDDGTWAAVVFQHRCGGLCGADAVYLLMRDPEGAWQVVVKELLSIA